MYYRFYRQNNSISRIKKTIRPDNMSSTILEQHKNPRTRRLSPKDKRKSFTIWRYAINHENKYQLQIGKELTTPHQIPSCYGSYSPTAIFVPFSELQAHWQLVTTELFGPFQIVTSYNDQQLDEVIKQLNNMNNFLTCAVVSNDQHFLNQVLGQTINGTTYAGIRARTTGAPQNHWFGPAGDPRSAGIGSKEAILQCWSYHREIINDYGPIPNNWIIPQQQ